MSKTKKKRNYLKELVEQAEVDIIMGCLEDCDFNQTKTAEALGIHRNTLVDKITRYKIDRRHIRFRKAVSGPTFRRVR